MDSKDECWPLQDDVQEVSQGDGEMIEEFGGDKKVSDGEVLPKPLALPRTPHVHGQFKSSRYTLSCVTD